MTCGEHPESLTLEQRAAIVRVSDRLDKINCSYPVTRSELEAVRVNTRSVLRRLQETERERDLLAETARRLTEQLDAVRTATGERERNG